MILRVLAVGLTGLVVATAGAAVLGAGLAVAACAAKRRAEERSRWPDEPSAPAPEAAD